MKNELMHYGIPGMRWGVRRSRAQLAGGRRKSNTDNWSEDAKTASALKKKNVHELSNAELRKLNERKMLEQQYANLNKRQKTIGEKIAGEILKECSKEIAKDYVKKYMKGGIEKAIEYARN